MDHWKQTLKLMVDRHAESKRYMDREKIAGREQLLRWQTGKQGPTVRVLERVIFGLGLTWHDWATLYDEVERTAPNAAETRSMLPLVRDGPKQKIKGSR
ncbi:MAG: hypothetical protein Q7U76_12530 [Nitrospirota bacterium]|nr:hypothetical protein [Nitrospirota bacterium]